MSASFQKTACPEFENLDRVATGRATQAEWAAAHRHALRCEACRDALVALSLAGNPGSEEEEVLLERALRLPPRLPAVSAVPARRSRPHWSVRRIAIAGATAACLALVTTALFGRDDAPDLAPLAAIDSRPIEGRLSLGLPHAPYRPTRGVFAEGLRLEETLAELVAQKREDPVASAAPLAAVYLYRGKPGDLGRAEEELQAAAPGPERDNDRAVVLLAAGRAEEAIASLQSALAVRPNYPAARFNLAIALQALGRGPEAARALRDYLAAADVEGAEAAWVAEARERLAALERGDR